MKTGFILIAGTVCIPDSYSISTLTAHWICMGVKHGAKKLKRLGIIV